MADVERPPVSEDGCRKGVNSRQYSLRHADQALLALEGGRLNFNQFKT